MPSRHLQNSILLILYCLAGLFLLNQKPSALIVLAFLFSLSLCCLDEFLGEFPVLILLSVYLLCVLFSYSTGAFMLFLPSALYPVYRLRISSVLTAAACILLLWLLFQWTGFPVDRLTYLSLGIVFSCFLGRYAASLESLTLLYQKSRDDSEEHALLLTEKNRALLEKQNYEIYAATLKERNRIAREIHDNVGHMLSRSILLVGALKATAQNHSLAQLLDSLDLTLNDAMNSIRKSVHDLHDESISLKESIEALISEFTFCPVSLQYDTAPDIPRDIKYSLISITKEALSNIIRHSDASFAEIRVIEHPGLYQLSVKDNGTRIQGGSIAKRKSSIYAQADSAFGSRYEEEDGMGLQSMKERTAALNGTFHIQTEHGFQIFITIPKERTHEHSDHR